MSDYSRPSVDVERRADAEWLWGVTHTVRREKLAVQGVEHSITVKVQPAPTPQDLMTSGGATLEEMQQRSPQRATEVFVEFNHRHPTAGDAPLFTYSYGERVATGTVDSFEPFVRRAEDFARAHQALFDVPGAASIPCSIAHREWFMADNLVTVELQLRPY